MVKVEDKEQYAQILILISNVENAKQIHLADEERKTLAIELLRLEEAIEKTRMRANYVKYRKDYTRIPLDYWIEAEPLLSQSQATALVEKVIAGRREQFKKLHLDEDKLAEDGLIDISRVYARRREELRECIGATLRKRVKRVEWFIKTAPEEIKAEIAATLNHKGMLGNDPLWRQILHLFAPDVLTEVEAIMTRQPDGGQ